MGKIITIPQDEVMKITKRSTLVGMDYNPKTLDECTKLYRDAPQIAEIAKSAIVDGLQGKALLEAKKLICGDEWNKAGNLSGSLSKTWQIFLQSVSCSKQQASYLLDFAGYKEDGGEIETASHYREVKKRIGTDSSAIDEAYNDAGGKDLKTAKDVAKSIKSISVLKLFEQEVGTFESVMLSTMQLQDKLTECIPDVSQEEWKSFYRKVSHCIHPDKGGEEIEMMMLSSFNKMMNILFKQVKEVQKSKEYRADYAQWKEDRGYESDWIKEEEL